MPNFAKKDLKDLFNVQDDEAALSFTYVPRENQLIVNNNKDKFASFAKNFAVKKEKK